MVNDAGFTFTSFMLDANGMVTSWNDYARHMKGYHAHEIIGQHFSIFYPEDRAASGFPQAELTWAAKMGHYANEGWRVRKDGSLFWAHILIFAQRDAKGALIGFIKHTHDMTKLHDQRKPWHEERARTKTHQDHQAMYSSEVQQPS